MSKFKVGDKVINKGSTGNPVSKPVVETVVGIGIGCITVEHPLGYRHILSLDYHNVEHVGEPNNVDHPTHYNQSGIECIDAIKASLGDGFPDYCKGNVIKYLWRYKYKNGLEDLKKAQVYLGWMIDYLEENE